MMSTQPVLDQDAFHGLLEKMWKEVSDADSLYRLRTKSWNHYEFLGLPDRKNEVFKYIKLRQFFTHQYQAGSGSFSPVVSDKKVVILPLSKAMGTYSAFLTNQWSQNLKEETDPFASLNGALFGEGLFIYVPPKTIVEMPIELCHLIDAHDQPLLMHPRIHVFVGQNAQVKFISKQKVLSGKQYGVNGYISFAIEDGAHVSYTQAILDEPDDVWHFEAVRVILKRDSMFKSIQVTDGSATIRHDYRVSLTGENGEALLNGVWMLAGKRQAHVNVRVEHVAPYCRSNQFFKGALNDVSRSSFEGKIYVHPEAQKTEAFQLNNNLLLSDYAQADSKPNLEIFADDVKASHGATVGQLDPEQLFYLKTRGFSDTDAKNLLIYGFCKEVIDMIDDSALHEEVTQRAQRYIIER